jgi:hypothetical protein
MKPRLDSRLMEERVRETFQRLPLLEGFTFDQQLELADIELRSCPGCYWGDEVYGDIGEEIAALVSDLQHTQIAELLRGRTFARILQ